LSWPWSSERPRAEDSGLRRRVPAEPRREAERRTGSRTWRRLLDGSAPEPVPSHHGTVEDPQAGKVGICCSGGGIRSAAFCLGALQSLQEEGELRRAAYLAAVSGGSYIAGAISMVALSDESASGPGGGNSDAERLRRKKPFAPGSPEEQYLRNRSSYLAPTLTDKIYLGWRLLLGLLFNLVFIATPLIGLTLVLTGLFYAPLVPDLAGPCGRGCEANIPAGFWIAPLAALGVAALSGLTTLLLRFRTDRRARVFAVWATRALIIAALLGLLLVALPYLVDWIEGSPTGSETVAPSTGQAAPKFGAALLALIAGVIAQLGHLLSSQEAKEGVGRARKALGRLGSGARLALAYLAAALAGPVLLLAVVALTLAVGLGEASAGRVDGGLILVGAAVLAVWAVVYAFADLTTWSLHPYYKRRLSSAFALKRIAAADRDEAERERVEAILPDGGADDPGIAVERDFDKLVPLSETALSETQAKEWPTLLVCASANVSDTAATPPGRAVTSFTFSAHTVGGPLVGAVATWEMETPFESRAEAFPDPSARKPQLPPQPRTIFEWAADRARARRRRDLTLPAAIAMSGAAVSPSMGKMTRRPLTFLMALANLRLGVWVPNPRWLGEWNRDERLRNRNLRPRPSYLMRELFGLNRIGAKYLYVTDGGHYENLGLVELLRRGCTEVYCFDASGVGKGKAEFQELGEAIALARSELGVEIHFETDPEELAPDKESTLAKKDLARGTISYPDGSGGTLIYVRNSITAKAPWDALAYHKADPRFPHNPTVDQLYTDQKFEAYRVLGLRAGAEAVEEMRSA
jgi:hypothetical protein